MISDEELSTAEGDRAEVAVELTQRVMSRLNHFPTRHYWRIETRDGGVEKVEDDVGRDLFLTYTAVKSSLEEFDRGKEHRDFAIWSWRYTFWLDWGRHATRAIQALHAHFHEEVNHDA